MQSNEEGSSRSGNKAALGVGMGGGWDAKWSFALVKSPYDDRILSHAYSVSTIHDQMILEYPTLLL